MSCKAAWDENGILANSYILMLVSDLDNTMVDHKDPNHQSLLEFGSLWQAAYANNSLLVYSTGRSPTLYKDLRSKVPLITPDIVIMSVGTEIAYGATMEPDIGWEEYLNDGWDRQVVVEEARKFSQLRFQTDTEQRPHKVSFHLEKQNAGSVVDDLKKSLQGRGLKVKLIYSGGYDLDVLPERAGKGQALAYLLRQFDKNGHPPVHTLACGDSGNDAELFTVNRAYGVIVGNAMEELLEWYRSQQDTSHIFHATKRCAGGIIEAIKHFQLGTVSSPRGSLTCSGDLRLGSRAFFNIVRSYVDLESWMKGSVEYDTALSKLMGRLDGRFTWITKGYEGTSSSYATYLKDLFGTHKHHRFSLWVDRLRCLHVNSDGMVVSFRVVEDVDGKHQVLHIVTLVLLFKADDILWLHLHETTSEGSTV